jgi:hypothetical protein
MVGTGRKSSHDRGMVRTWEAYRPVVDFGIILARSLQEAVLDRPVV